MKASLLLILLLALSACSIHLSDQNFIRETNRNAAPAQINQPASGYQLNLEELTLEDGTSVRGYSYQSNTNTLSVLYYLGNAGEASETMDFIQKFAESQELNIYIFDRRGYGRSDGDAAGKHLKKDALAVYDFVAQTQNKIVVHGHSLGSFEASSVAAARPVAGLVLETPATNPQDMIDELFPWYLKLISNITLDETLNEFDNLVAVAQSTSPLLVLAAGKDQETTIGMAQDILTASASSQKTLVVFDDASHNNVPMQDSFEQAYSEFVKTL